MKKLGVLCMVGAVAGSVLLAPGTANAAGDHFVMFSNRSGYAPHVCAKVFTSTTNANGTTGWAEGPAECKTVYARKTHVFRVSTLSALMGIRVTVNDGGGHTFKQNYMPLDRDLCLRETTSGTIHEATDKPCTDK